MKNMFLIIIRWNYFLNYNIYLPIKRWWFSILLSSNQLDDTILYEYTILSAQTYNKIEIITYQNKLLTL